MPTRSFLKSINWIIFLPVKILSRCLIGVNAFMLRDDFDRCIKAVDGARELPNAFINALIAAEDHRNAFHLGVDPVGIFRAVYVALTTGKRQGASTIEQQFVRVVTQRYELTIRRKFREQILAIAICSSCSKRKIAEAYLCIAFYGFEKTGYSVIQDCINGRHEDVLHVIACLRYPEPAVENLEWRARIKNRICYIDKRLVVFGLVDS